MLEGIWTDTPSGKHCKVHDEDFSRIGACSQCADTLLDGDDKPVLVIPEGGMSVHQIECRYVALAKVAEKHARDALESDDWHERALAPKLLDSALKALRAAAVIATTRAAEHRVNILLHEAKRMRGRH